MGYSRHPQAKLEVHLLCTNCWTSVLSILHPLSNLMGKPKAIWLDVKHRQIPMTQPFYLSITLLHLAT